MKVIESKQVWDYSINHKTIILSQNGNEIVASGEIQETKEEIMICSIYVNEKYRGQGFGKQLMILLESVYKKYTEVFLRVKRDNEIAIKLYQSVGFNFYSIEEPGIFMFMSKKNDVCEN